MKKITIILLIFSALTLTTCKKLPELKVYELNLANENVAYSQTSAEITVDYEYPTQLQYVNVTMSRSNYFDYSFVARAEVKDSIIIANFVDLQTDKNYYYKFEYSNGVNVVTSDVRSFYLDAANVTLPTVITMEVHEVQGNTAVGGGEIIDDGGYYVTARGVCWSTHRNPTIFDNYTTDGMDTGSYTSTMTGLSEHTVYYVRAFAINEKGTSYGTEYSFETILVGGGEITLPTVITGDVTNITSTTASCGGNVTNTGGATVTQRGVCWSTNENPTISDSHTTDDTGAGSFTSNLTGLTENTTYYVRAYATNSIGTRYGNQVMFMTAGENISFTVNGVTFEMVAVAGGTFTMGGTSEQGSDVYDNELPTHSVTLSSFHLGKYEVTQALWQAVMGSNPSYFSGSDQPVEQVSWNDCQEFITQLNQLCSSQLNGKQFTLPTEAQWEYAARGGNQSMHYKYSGSNSIDDVAWYTSNSGSKTHQVGTKSPNELGIYDMSGNVWEWCQDWYGSYSSGSQTNPTGPSSGSYRVNRGGGGSLNARDCRVSYRHDDNPGLRYYYLGFRLALVQ